MITLKELLTVTRCAHRTRILNGGIDEATFSTYVQPYFVDEYRHLENRKVTKVEFVMDSSIEHAYEQYEEEAYENYGAHVNVSEDIILVITLMEEN